ncbi:MAG TPA: hypothetical protein VHB21_08470 [Minicystis sp.]|nr:hypothetical protein [Minicystis sp.]
MRISFLTSMSTIAQAALASRVDGRACAPFGGQTADPRAQVVGVDCEVPH